jgi:hypothetical protein
MQRNFAALQAKLKKEEEEKKENCQSFVGNVKEVVTPA